MSEKMLEFITCLTYLNQSFNKKIIFNMIYRCLKNENNLQELAVMVYADEWN